MGDHGPRHHRPYIPCCTPVQWQEAVEEYRRWEASYAPMATVNGYTFRKPVRREPCPCGRPHFAKGKCSTCYFRDYNRRRPKRSSGHRDPVKERARRARYRKRQRLRRLAVERAQR